MTKPIVIIMGEPNSIFSELIFKIWKKRKKLNLLPFILIGNINILEKQFRFLKYKTEINNIKSDFNLKDITNNKLPVINVNYYQKKPFVKISKDSNKFIFNSFDVALDLMKKKKILGIINGPISKETLLKGKFNGITEFISSKIKSAGSEVMLLYNKNFSISPITTHIPINKVSKKINTRKIISNTKNIVHFYKKYFNKKIKIGITGLNPHSYSSLKNSEENKIIIPAIKKLKENKINISGPLSADSLFLKKNYKKYDVIIGMYHDQVLTPFKTIFGQNGINITLGLPFLRLSPDHGVAKDIIGRKIANPTSLIQCIKFFRNLK